MLKGNDADIDAQWEYLEECEHIEKDNEMIADAIREGLLRERLLRRCEK